MNPDTSETVRRMVIAFKNSGYTDCTASQQIATWRLSICPKNVNNIQNIYKEAGSVESERKKYGRDTVLGKKTSPGSCCPEKSIANTCRSLQELKS